MHRTNRREFFRVAGLAAAAGAVAGRPSWAAARRIKMCLNTGNIGVKADLMQSIAMAAKFGFEAVGPPVPSGKARYVPMLLSLSEMPARIREDIERWRRRTGSGA